MSLADLKKQEKPKAKVCFSVDDFIEDANNYAMGKPQIVSAEASQQAEKFKKQFAEDNHCEAGTPFKHATFTLSDSAIQQLNELSEQTHIPKSRLLRIMVHDFFFNENPNKFFLSDIK
ncbi:ribbon-helix-helix domain-containing protein [Thalassotalea mangrovi]|uniref:Ribbon-helix-helix domain-containing protein n=1 Tax=Thalassotalea mangrovi TaxID=2572245 RepID=A0A4U1B3K4_9GAMM|nr:ribbon-helix-helix domain-containing protein [Thalassotalea mangrovi]TKB44106.1 ribbon-helix-helix domain-containing protein [Thalassotalea mangrovi]